MAVIIARCPGHTARSFDGTMWCALGNACRAVGIVAGALKILYDGEKRVFRFSLRVPDKREAESRLMVQAAFRAIGVPALSIVTCRV